MSPATIAFFRAAIIIIAPVTLLAAFVLHPHVGNPIDHDFLEKLAAAVAADPAHWAVVHYFSAVAIGLLTLAFIAVRGFLRETGKDSWSRLGLPFIILGNVFYAMLPAFEFAPYAAVRAGLDPEAIQGALMPWFVSTIRVSALLFTIGAVSFAVEIAQSGIFNSVNRWLIPGTLIVMALCRFVPLNAIQFYVQGFAGIVALFPLAYVIWKYADAHPAVKTMGIAYRPE